MQQRRLDVGRTLARRRGAGGARTRGSGLTDGEDGDRGQQNGFDERQLQVLHAFGKREHVVDCLRRMHAKEIFGGDGFAPEEREQAVFDVQQPVTNQNAHLDAGHCRARRRKVVGGLRADWPRPALPKPARAPVQTARLGISYLNPGT